MPVIHEDLKMRVGQGLAWLNNLIDINGNGTDWSACTTVATFNAVTDPKVGLSTYHETDKAIFVISDRKCSELNQMGIWTDTAITAFNTTATGEAAFTALDPTFPAGYHGARSF